MVPVVGFSQEVLFDSAGVYIRSTVAGINKWSGYELVIRGKTNFGDSVFVVNHFKARFPSLDSLYLMASYNTDLPIMTELSQESTPQGITCERADSLSHFEFRYFFLIKNYSKNDVKLSLDQVDVEIILYGIMYPILNKHDSTECIGQKREWSRVLSIPRRDKKRKRSYLKYTPIGKK